MTQTRKLLTTTLLFGIVLIAFAACSQGSTEPQAVQQLDSPSELTVTRFGKTAVRLSWKDNSTTEDGFVVERKVGQGVFQERLFTTQNVNAEVDSVNMQVDSTYSYRVHAIRYLESSTNSNTVSVRLTLPFP